MPRLTRVQCCNHLSITGSSNLWPRPNRPQMCLRASEMGISGKHFLQDAGLSQESRHRPSSLTSPKNYRTAQAINPRTSKHHNPPQMLVHIQSKHRHKSRLSNNRQSAKPTVPSTAAAACQCDWECGPSTDQTS
jgi:hypothetical protein